MLLMALVYTSVIGMMDAHHHATCTSTEAHVTSHDGHRASGHTPASERDNHAGHHDCCNLHNHMLTAHPAAGIEHTTPPAARHYSVMTAAGLPVISSDIFHPPV